jgi:hypothetical protein
MVLGFLAAAWAALVALLAFAPDVFEQTLKQLPFADPHPFELVFVAALSVVLMSVAVGVVLGWRWTFWLMVAAFLAGLLRLPASVLELTGAISLTWPCLGCSASGHDRRSPIHDRDAARLSPRRPLGELLRRPSELSVIGIHSRSDPRQRQVRAAPDRCRRQLTV